MPDLFKPSSTTKLSTSECEELNVFSKLNGWETYYHQLNAGEFISTFDLYASEQLNIVNIHCNREMIANGVPPIGEIALFIILNEFDRGIYNGKQLQNNEAFIMRGGSEGTLKTPAHLNMISLKISEARLSEALMTMANSELDHIIPNTRRIILPQHTIRQLTESTQKVLRTPPKLDLNTGQFEDEELLISTLVNGLTDMQKDRGETGRISRRNSVLKAQEYIKSHLNAPLGLEILAKQSGASIRTLESAFREVYDTTPLRFIKTLRLHAARRLLLRTGDASITVTDIALKSGFNHMSYFSRDYKDLFGEYPSHTLRRSTACIA